MRFGDLARLLSALVAIAGAVGAVWHFTSRIESAVGRQAAAQTIIIVRPPDAGVDKPK